MAKFVVCKINRYGTNRIIMKHRSIIILLAAAIALVGSLTSAAPTGPDEVIPLIEMENVPLTDAIRKIAGWARLNIVIDPRLSAAPFDRMTVSIRWQNVTAREALT